MDKAKAKGKAKPAELAITASVTGPDGVTYTVTGCTVDEVRCALDEIREANQPAELNTAGTPEVQS